MLQLNHAKKPRRSPPERRGFFVFWVHAERMETHTVRLFGGPLDGMTLPKQPVTDDPGAYMIVPGERGCPDVRGT